MWADSLGRLDAALSAPIWLYGDAPADKSKGEGIAFDLNTAEREGLQALPGIDAATADRIVAERRAHGPYDSLAAASSRLSLSPATTASLQSLHEAAKRAGPNARR